jgi:hypothetical protein
MIKTCKTQYFGIFRDELERFGSRFQSKFVEKKCSALWLLVSNGEGKRKAKKYHGHCPKFEVIFVGTCFTP